jgi:hypothetical protein
VAPPLLKRRRHIFLRDATGPVDAGHSRDQTLARMFGARTLFWYSHQGMIAVYAMF